MAALKSKANKAVEQQMMGRSGKTSGNIGITKAKDDTDALQSGKPDNEKKNLLDFLSNDKEDVDHGKVIINEEDENSISAPIRE